MGQMYHSDLSTSHWELWSSGSGTPGSSERKWHFHSFAQTSEKDQEMPVYQPVEGEARSARGSLTHSMEWASEWRSLTESPSQRKARQGVNSSLCFCQGRGFWGLCLGCFGGGAHDPQRRHFARCSSWFTETINTIQNKLTAPGLST